MSSEVRSFFESKSHQTKRVWEKFNQIQYQDDVIEFVELCDRVSRMQLKLKKIDIEIGEETMYGFKKKHPLGQISLAVALINIKQFEGGEVIRISKGGHYIDLLIGDKENLRKLLMSKCIQTTFHNDFQVIKMIGKGSFANVYLAQKHSNGIQYAIKAFNKLYIQGQYKGKEGLENEIRVMRRLKQQNILHLHEVHETQNSIYFVLDLLDGGELLKRAQTTIFSAPNIQKLTYNLLRAIFHMHQKKCIHRDLKPENLLLKSKENNVEIVIADFGLAHILDTEAIYKRCGTPGFVAPEILSYQDNAPFYDGKCDVFSLGVIFYLLVTGTHPFGSGDHTAVLIANKNCLINFEIKQIQRSPPNLQSLLQQMLKRNPIDRLSAEECLKHPYFSDIFNESDLLETNEDLQNYYNSIKMKKEDDLIVGSYQILTKQQQWNGQTDTIGSISNCSNNSSANKIEKQQSNLSRFSQFCQQMKQESPSGCPNQQIRKKDNQNLHKFALKNSYQQNLKSKDDDFVEEEQTNVGSQLQTLNKQTPKMGLLKKSQSLNVD